MDRTRGHLDAFLAGAVEIARLEGQRIAVELRVVHPGARWRVKPAVGARHDDTRRGERAVVIVHREMQCPARMQQAALAAAAA